MRKAVVDLRYHFIENLIPDGTRANADLTNDPGEDHDLQGERDLPMKSVCPRSVVGVDGRRCELPADFCRAGRAQPVKQPLPAPIRTSARIGKYLELIGIDAVTRSAARRPS